MAGSVIAQDATSDLGAVLVTLGAVTVYIGLGEPVHEASLRRGEGPGTRGGVKPLLGERSSGTVANEPLETRPVLGPDANGAMGSLPVSHAWGPSPSPGGSVPRYGWLSFMRV